MRFIMRASLCLVWAAGMGLLALGAYAEEAQKPSIPAASLSAGDKITLHLENENITSVLRLLSEARQVNIISGPEVSGTVTINLYDAPFEEALTAILGVAGYTHYRLGDIIYVTTEAKKAELPPAAQDLAVKLFTLDHIEAQEILELIDEFLSSGGNALLAGNRQLVVYDAPYYLERIGSLIAELDTPPRQVLISAHIVSVRRDDNLDVGTGFDTLPLERYGVEMLTAGFAGVPFPPLPDALGEFDLEQLPTNAGLHVGTLQSDSRFFLEALNESADVDILAAPKILAVDGSVARIQVGDRLGFRITTTTETASLESVEFLEVGTVLEVTPHIAGDGLVRMEIQPKVSTGSVGKEGLPTETTTELETEMLVQDGQTIVIGGLLNATREKRRTQIPFLGDIPLLGKLFGSNHWRDDRNEVIVLIRPDIVGHGPSPEMLEKMEGVQRTWGEMQKKGLINKETRPLKGSPSRWWHGLFRRRGMISPRQPEGVQDKPEAAVREESSQVPEVTAPSEEAEEER